MPALIVIPAFVFAFAFSSKVEPTPEALRLAERSGVKLLLNTHRPATNSRPKRKTLARRVSSGTTRFGSKRILR